MNGATKTKRTDAGGRPRRIVVLAFDAMEALDLSGPLAVFHAANRLRAEQGRGPAYRTEIVTPGGGTVTSVEGLVLAADRAIEGLRGPYDTVMVAGGPEPETFTSDERLVRWLRRAAPRSRRLASVCTGSFLLAEAGLLDGRRACTHWLLAERMARQYPAVRVDADPIYVRDGEVWTSAGVAAGMDLTLALLEADLGRQVATDVARALVLYLRRPGSQAQCSRLLAAQAAGSGVLRELPLWIAENLNADLGVEALADRAAMSPRHFARVFVREFGMTPARFVERLRVEAACRSLEDGVESIKRVADLAGFGSAETMRGAFLRVLRLSPRDFRERCRPAGPGA